MPSNGSFWYGRSTGFPGFLYKRNTGVGARRSTKMGPGGVCNSSTDINNKYKPGQGGVGASSTSNRRAKNRHATICNNTILPAPNCFPCYMTLGQYSNYTHNPNGYYPCITLPPLPLPLPSLPLPVVPPSYTGKMGNATFDTSTAGMFDVDFGKYGNDDNGYEYLSFTGMNFFFFGINYGNSDGSVPANSIYMNTNFAFGFGQGQKKSNNWPETWPAILFDFFNTVTYNTYFSIQPQPGLPGVKFVRILFTGTDTPTYTSGETNKEYEIYFIIDNSFQYIQFNCKLENATTMNRSKIQTATNPKLYGSMSNITNGTAFQNTFGSFGDNPPDNEGPQTGGSYVIRSDLFGNNWKFFPNTHIIFK